MLLVVLPGCGTILTTTLLSNNTSDIRNEIPWIYSGTYFDYHCFWHPETKKIDNAELFCLYDIPLSVVADTVILPVTIPLQFSSKKTDKKTD